MLAESHMAIKPAQERDTPAVSLPQLTLSVRLCDYEECRKPLYRVLQCAKCKRRRLLLQRLPGVLTTTPCLCTEQASKLPICSFASHARVCNM